MAIKSFKVTVSTPVRSGKSKACRRTQHQSISPGYRENGRGIFLENKAHNLSTDLILGRDNYGNTLLGIKYWGIGRRVGEEMAEEFCKLGRGKIFLIERWSLTYRNHCFIEIGPNELSSLTGKFATGCGCRDDRSCQNQSLQWPKSNTFAESN